MQLDDKTRFDPDPNLFQDNNGFRKRSFPAWTGLNDKTLWDILQFLCTAAVPIVLTVWSMQQAQIARVQEEQSQNRNDDNQRAKIMSDYLDAMTKYLLEDSAKAPVSSKMIARARTLNTLRQLDPNRKGQLLKFLYEADLVKCKPDPKTEKMPNCKVSKLGLDGARLDELIFDPPIPMPGIDLTGASLPRAELPSIDLNRAHLEKANLERAKLGGANLTQAQLNSVILRDADLTGAILEKADLTEALLLNADLSGARLASSSLKRAYLKNAKLNDSDLTEADLQGADLRSATLNDSNLIKTDLRDADLTDATLTGTINLKGALYNQRTKFPANFNPIVKGMIHQN